MCKSDTNIKNSTSGNLFNFDRAEVGKVKFLNVSKAMKMEM